MNIDKEEFQRQYLDKVAKLHGKPLEETSDGERYQALSSLIRDYIGQRWLLSRRRQRQGKQVYYLSIEFLLGRLTDMYLINLGLRDTVAAAFFDLGVDLAAILESEEDPGLGNGGLGRLAACYLDSMAAESLPGHGCGLRYRYGFFEQDFVNGRQIEVPDDWLKTGFIYEFRRSDEAVEIRFGGTVTPELNGKLRYRHENYESVLAVPYDVPVVGHLNDTVNTLRLWSAEPHRTDFVCSATNRNDCLKTIEYKNDVEAITSVLYPDDSTRDGRVLRLKQHYFLTSASLQAILADLARRDIPLTRLSDHVAVHINDTHPALAVPELMRLLIDEHGMGWDEAWSLTVATISYTNHTIMPEALETWPVDLFQALLPRIFVIVNEINERFCRELWQRYPGDWDHIRAMAVIADGTIRMAHLAIAGSHSVNGVAQLHTRILKERVMSDFHQFYPDKFNNKTNGVTHRRFLIKANPQLAALLGETVGEQWVQYPCDLLGLLPHAADPAFQDKLAAIRRWHKSKLAAQILDATGVRIDPDSIFDTHVKRIHGYKRQTLNAFHIMHLYNRLKADPGMDLTPRTFIFGGKAAPAYRLAKLTIRFINALADKINRDKTINDKIKVVFLENYNVSLLEKLLPATDVSEQIPTASREACGTGNMKFIMNGSVIIGTLDGGNIEIRNAVGEDNIITFGLTADEVLNIYERGGYNPWDIYCGDERVKTVLDQLVNGFLPGGPDEYRPIFDSFLHHGDHFLVLKDFAAYVDAQKELERRYRDRRHWLSMSVRNIAHSGKFSGDRTFTEYAVDIWRLRPEAPVRCYCSADEDFARAEGGCTLSRRPALQATLSNATYN
ncbi:glycogen/starch/alpha-glucan phosphorylase [Anaeroselena agilis]|uniref:Alpha-1,4 glucan phosphorylase n=1 Tax=Anaeroselena agilis TaxID=3063788 RepID=A0ABU3NV53_9FIRM|nr:glycogen/starch/alpha-glucan phosphorylase [Selenomonadales bacterium 4137-cl]